MATTALPSVAQRCPALLGALPTRATRRTLKCSLLSAWSTACVHRRFLFQQQQPQHCVALRTAASLPDRSSAGRARVQHSTVRHAFNAYAGAELTVAEHHRQAGYLHLIVGPMFAGKTTTLLNELLAEEESGRAVLVAKSDRDGRYSTHEVVSHDGLRRPCRAVKNLKSLISLPEYELANVVAVDEAQFFSDLVEFCRIAVDRDHKRVHVAGLDGDFRREPFGKVVQLMPLADRITKRTGLCKHCGHASLFSLRTVSDKSRVLVGGNEAYEPVCRPCYVARHQDAPAEPAAGVADGAPLAR